MTSPETIELHVLAPAKPSRGAACNGCGACCALEPCPVATVFLFQFEGRCRALRWQAEGARYACGLVTDPRELLPLLPDALAPAARRLFARRIAAGAGCDADIEILADADTVSARRVS